MNATELCGRELYGSIGSAAVKYYLVPNQEKFYLDAQAAYDAGVTPEEIIEIQVPHTVPGVIFLVMSDIDADAQFAFTHSPDAIAKMRATRGGWMKMLALAA